MSNQSGGRTTEPEAFPVALTEAEWQARLSPEAYRILRRHSTERAGASPLNDETRSGQFLCAGCQQVLFDSEDKYESGSGWPSFTRPAEGAVATKVDKTLFMTRIEVHCSRCGGHLGHVFEDGPAPTGLRFCMNGAAMTFDPA